MKRRMLLVFCLISTAFTMNETKAASVGQPELQAELMAAISKKDLRQVRMFFADPEKRLNIQLNQRRTDGWTPLALASALESPSIVRILLDNGAATSVGAMVNQHEYSPLILAAQYHQPKAAGGDVLQVLLNRFKFQDYEREIQNAANFKQFELRQQLKILQRYQLANLRKERLCRQTKREPDQSTESRILPAEDLSETDAILKSDVEEAPPEIKENLYPGDELALSFQEREVLCTFCMEVPGAASATRLLNGDLRTGNSVDCPLCGKTSCRACFDRWIAQTISHALVFCHCDGDLRKHIPKFPSCKDALPNGVVYVLHTNVNEVPEFVSWAGTEKVSIPDTPAP